MKKILIIICGLFGIAYGQSIGYLRYDSVKIMKSGGNGELIIENATRGVTGGVLTNTGNGRTAFVAPGAYGDSLAWKITGNSGTTAGTNFIGTTDNVDLVFKRNSVSSGTISHLNTAFGYHSLEDITSGEDNTSFGNLSLSVNTSGNSNVAVGLATLAGNTTGSSNTAIGTSSLSQNNGSGNTAVGVNSLNVNSTGTSNTALGGSSLLSNSTGEYNLALGSAAGAFFTTESYRVFLNTIARGNKLGDSTQSIIYGAQDAAATNQRLYLNSQVYLPYATAAANAADSMMVILPGTGKVGYRAIPTSSGGTVTGSGTANTMTKWTGTSAIGDALSTDNGTTIGIISPATTTTGFDLSSSTLTTGALATFTMTGTAAASNTKRGLVIVSSGANTNASQTVTGQTISVTNTGTTNTNVGLSVTASGATNNYAALFTGLVGIGMNPVQALDVTTTTNASTSLQIKNTNTGGSAYANFSAINDAGGQMRLGMTSTNYATYGALTALQASLYTTSDIAIGTDGAKVIKFATGAGYLERMRVDATGNVGIGTTSPTAAKLQVTGNGAASVSGGLWDGTWFSGGTSTTTKPQLLIEPTGATSTNWNTAGTGLGVNAASGFAGSLFDYQVNGVKHIYSTFTSNVMALNLDGNTDNSVINFFSSPLQKRFYIRNNNAILTTGATTGTAGYAMNWDAPNTTDTRNNGTYFNFTNNFSPTSGTVANNAMRIAPTINQTGGATGITRGLYINPTITAATDFRALEVEVGNSIFGSTSGNVGIGTTSPTAAKLQVTGNGAASVSGGLWDGTWFSGGTSTTTKPQLLIEPTGTTSTAWSTNGTGLGINAASGFTGNLIDAQLNGASRFYVNSTGYLRAQNIESSGYFQLGGSSYIQFAARTYMQSSADGNLSLLANAGGFGLLQFGGTTTSFPAIARNGTGIDIKLADNSAYTNIAALTTRTTAVAFASLPAGVTGMIATVNNSTTNTWGATIAGGGANTVLAFFNGTNWTVIGQ